MKSRFNAVMESFYARLENSQLQAALCTWADAHPAAVIKAERLLRLMTRVLFLISWLMFAASVTLIACELFFLRIPLCREEIALLAVSVISEALSTINLYT